MKHLKDVKVYDEKQESSGHATRSHWITSAPLEATIEWDAGIIDERENELIAWRSVEGADADNSGSIHFQPASHDRGTEVNVVMEYNPPAGAIGA